MNQVKSCIEILTDHDICLIQVFITTVRIPQIGILSMVSPLFCVGRCPWVQPQNKEQPVLMIFDGHASHTRNLDIIEKARENNVVPLCLLSHMTHRLQLLDVSFFRSLKCKYNEEVRLWLRNHPGRRLCEDQVAEVFSDAYQAVATVDNAVNGSCKSGIEPFNHNTYKID